MKRFISLGAAIMMGTVLSKHHEHADKSVEKAKKHKDKGFLDVKKDSIQSIEDAEV